MDSVLSSIQVLEQVIVGFPAHGKEFSPRLRSPSILSRWKFLPTGWKTSHDLAIPMHSPFMVPKLGRMHHYIFDIPGNWCEPWTSTHTYIDIYIGHKVINFSTKTTLLDQLWIAHFTIKLHRSLKKCLLSFAEIRFIFYWNEKLLFFPPPKKKIWAMPKCIEHNSIWDFP